MDWKLIFGLSMFGLVMGIATVFWIPSNIEPFCWLAIFLISGFAIGRSAHWPFVRGVLVGLANRVWITGAHILFVGQYLANHAREAAMMKSGPLPASPRVMMALTGPVVGLISGIIIGLLGLLASKLGRPKQLAGN
jgi:hypothetical protein